MIPSEPQARRKTIEYMLSSCKTSIDDLTKWEQVFISSIDDQFGKKQTLSDRQCEILEQIYDKL